ncbi:hypothetical protein E2N90_28845 [Pseudomonas syringae pv. tomato]|nr:hypothetical protein EIZ61_01050 [Pseudomonas syringae]TES60485.1 hypothetical protein E2N91_05305 [Pseudomonas syringae pv. tomato]TES62836.1 hypothetical protein E2N90_28845 [Pseudomonas syringae pv. tomato]TES80363.1 hypothetical protein E2N89_04325 [Pseudomonas syringae pv. tomato]
MQSHRSLDYPTADSVKSAMQFVGIPASLRSQSIALVKSVPAITITLPIASGVRLTSNGHLATSGRP